LLNADNIKYINDNLININEIDNNLDEINEFPQILNDNENINNNDNDINKVKFNIYIPMPDDIYFLLINVGFFKNNLNEIIDGNEIIIFDSEPLKVNMDTLVNENFNYTFSIGPNLINGFTRKYIVEKICENLHKIYDEEEETTSITYYQKLYKCMDCTWENTLENINDNEICENDHCSNCDLELIPKKFYYCEEHDFYQLKDGNCNTCNEHLIEKEYLNYKFINCNHKICPFCACSVLREGGLSSCGICGENIFLDEIKCNKFCSKGIIDKKEWVGKLLPKQLREEFTGSNKRPKTNGIHQINSSDIECLFLNFVIYDKSNHTIFPYIINL
jgi:hypothetical protein